MQLLIYLLAGIWVARILKNILSYTQLWHDKEYRFDRMFVHLKTKQGRWILFRPFRRPPISPKTIALVVLTVSSALVFVNTLPGNLLIKLLILDLLAFPITGTWVALLKIPTFILHQIRISQAILMLQKYPPKNVVGITGSFGKTSTKEYLATILASQFKVIKTAASKNSPIGIAEVILHKLNKSYDLFIVEMGAYKAGEIAHMCKMVKPEIGIVTAINAQHQDLFGSIENTIRAKYELIAALTGKKLAILNGDNPYTLAMAEWAKHDGCTVWVYTKNSKSPTAYADKVFYIEDVSGKTTTVQFTLKTEEIETEINANVLGEYQAQNITAAICAASACGMDLKAAAKAAENIHATPKNMEPLPGVNGATFINDTFNNNPDAAKAAIDYLAKSKGKKILVFQPMIELGKFGESAHEEVGAYAAKICDKILLTNNNFFAAFTKSIPETGEQKIAQVVSPHQGAKLIRSWVEKGDTVLFKGKEAENILKALRSRSSIS